jgi:ribose transport system ATP-binding protein
MKLKGLFNVIRELKKQDIIILYISHKLHEIPQITDTITVLRDGICVGKVNTKDVSHADILKMMFGETKQRHRPEDVLPQDKICHGVKNLSRRNKFNNVSFKLKKGEILGIAGMLGAGRTELLKSIFGADPMTAVKSM